MSKYKEMFNRLKATRQGAFVPFTPIGFPTVEACVDLIQALVDGGADALELGIPFSDPVADGPVIQAAGVKAIEAGCTPDKCFEVIATIRKKNVTIPIGLLVYGNLVVSNGIDAFYAKCEKAGVDSVLIADLPIFEAAPFLRAAKAHHVSPVFIAPPNATDATLEKLASITEGYTYVVTRSGVTGVDKDVAVENTAILTKLKSLGAPPPLLGFGISKPEHVKQALASGADGAIVGSAIVAKITEGQGDLEKLCKDLSAYIAEMKAATKPS